MSTEWTGDAMEAMQRLLRHQSEQITLLKTELSSLHEECETLQTVLGFIFRVTDDIEEKTPPDKQN